MLPALLGSRSPEQVGPREGEGTRPAPLAAGPTWATQKGAPGLQWAPGGQDLDGWDQ